MLASRGQLVRLGDLLLRRHVLGGSVVVFFVGTGALARTRYHGHAVCTADLHPGTRPATAGATGACVSRIPLIMT